MSQKRPTILYPLIFFALALTLMAMGLGCYPIRATLVPVPVLAPQPLHSERLVVLLPGRGGGDEDFRREGFFDAATQAGLQADVMAVDLHEGYYQDQTMLERLRQDVILPARARGCKEIWLVGVSMGGTGALLYAQVYPEEVQGVVVLAPFLGDESLIKEIGEAGGAEAWTPHEAIAAGDYARPLWRWIRQRGSQEQPCHVFLAYGTEDRFASACGLFAATLPKERVFTQRGGHEWRTWRGLWEKVLRSPTFKEGGSGNQEIRKSGGDP